jgi:hypothetical protein
MVGPSGNKTAVHLGPSVNWSKSIVDELFVHPKNEDLYPKISDQLSQCDSWTHC